MRYGRAFIAVGIRRASLVHAEARLGDPCAGVETVVINDGAANFFIRPFAGNSLGAKNRIARAVDREGKVLSVVEEEERTMRAVAIAIRVLRVRNASCSAVAVAFDHIGAVVRVVETSDAVRHRVNDVRWTTVVVVSAAEFNERAALWIRRAEERVDFGRTNRPGGRIVALRGRFPRRRYAGGAVDRLL